MDKPLVSVVVPAYNVEKYLDKCMQSLLAQTYPNFEIILVNDGSSDNTGKMCDAYAKHNLRIRCFHEENHGQSIARNFGVQQAKGDWVVFVDSDDYVTPNYIEYLVNLKKKFGVNMSIARSINVYSDTPSPSKKSVKNTYESKLTADDALKKMCYGQDFGVSPCAKLYPISVLKKYPYPANMLYEDLATTYKLIDACGTIAFGTQCIYYYRQRPKSSMHAQISDKRLYGFAAVKEMLDYMSSRHPDVVFAAHGRCAIKAVEFMPNLLHGTKFDRDFFKRIQKELRPHYKIVIADYEAPLALKLKSTAVMLGYWPSVMLWKVWWMLKGIPDVYDYNTE